MTVVTNNPYPNGSKGTMPKNLFTLNMIWFLKIQKKFIVAQKNSTNKNLKENLKKKTRKKNNNSGWKKI